MDVVSLGLFGGVTLSGDVFGHGYAESWDASSSVGLGFMRYGVFNLGHRLSVSVGVAGLVMGCHQGSSLVSRAVCVW